MRVFEDHGGAHWRVGVREREGFDYKGRYHLVLTPVDGDGEVELTDVRWNSARTAERSVKTMSAVELRRRLRSAVGRASAS